MTAALRAAIALAAAFGAASGCSADRRDHPEDVDTDTDTDPGCDCEGLDDTTAEGLAAAMNLCPGPDVDVQPMDATSPEGEHGFGAVPQLGTSDCLDAPHRCVMLAISTGPLDEENPNEAEDMGGGVGDTDLDPQPEYQGGDPTTGSPVMACDRNQLSAVLTVPDGKQGFSFDFLFASSEYPEFLDSGYNDTFYAILEYDALNDGATTNIAFDDLGNEIEVDAEFFENDLHPCSEAGSHWSQSVEGGAGSTGWLRTSWPAAAGDTFRLTFSIHDEGDCLWDSIVLLDRFRWLAEAPTGTTVPIE